MMLAGEDLDRGAGDIQFFGQESHERLIRLSFDRGGLKPHTERSVIREFHTIRTGIGHDAKG